VRRPRFYRDIFAIRGDIGARQIIRDNPGSVTSIEIEGPEVFLDIDDDNDFKKLELMIRDRQKPEDILA
jgi:CTP:molybdopterin cytidylyltransferase MocA